MTEGMSPRPQSVNTQKMVTFSECLERMAQSGGRYRRLEWEDKSWYITIQDEILMVFRPDDKKLHPLKVSVGDITGEDWVVVERTEKMS